MNSPKLGKRRDEKCSPAREKLAEVLSLYREGFGTKAIARQLGISPRITREMLIESGEWKPTNPGSGEASKSIRLGALHAAMLKAIARGKDEQSRRLSELHAAMRRVVRRHRPRMTDAESFRHQYRTDPQFRVYQLLRRRMRKIIGTEGNTSSRMIALLGCSRDEFRAHIERNWKPGMTWSNNGTGKGKWHIDHVLPCASFDQTNPEHQKICWHFTNMKPMWSLDNIAKRDTIDHTNAQMVLRC